MKQFEHKHAAHCESGAASVLLNHYGHNISEAMCFGLSSAIAFVYFPFITTNSEPLLSYRMKPLHILKGLTKIVGVKFLSKTFGTDKEAGMKALDEVLAKGDIAGVQVSAYYMSYLPINMQIRFNGHNILIYKKEGDLYHVSDPVFKRVQTIKKIDLQNARFALGALAPKGGMYTFESVDKNIDLKKAIRKAIRKTTFLMLKIPFPYFGIWGMKTLAKKLSSLKTTTKEEIRYARLFIALIVKTQEEIGTGGGGFRYLYASFLQESAQILQNPLLDEAAQMMSDSGDKLRNFALIAARMLKNKDEIDTKKLGIIFLECALFEKDVYQKLRSLK